ncbi:MAG TPA: RNase adapter RapZ [Steroidobacteraceae bacterium]|nr:RNase adapter RapZ [Steroidobacteraceae bacterium]HNS26874.1 RNase adapter RapZ [Steroidobacteraceae bacterium]
MRLVVVSGLSGSGKSVALHMLEDLGYYCIDNIPAALLTPLISHTVRSAEAAYERIGVGLDARNTAAEIATVPKLIAELKKSGIQCEVLFLTTSDDELLRRFAETRRKHPMSRNDIGLREAIALERDLLEPMMYAADQVIDTSRMGVHALRDRVLKSADERATPRLAITFESFGFKRGIPGDADFVFDARSLPNPYWEPQLRPLTGQDPEVIRFLEAEPAVARLIEDIANFVEARIPEHTAANRRYLTVAIGCTGGQHRSVYIANQLAGRFSAHHPHVSTRHNELRERPGAH